MDENTTPTHCGRRTKRPYDESDPNLQDRSRSVSSPLAFMNAQSTNEGPSNHRPNAITLPPMQRVTRWNRDGLDFRRPVRSAESPISFSSTTSSSTITEMSRRSSVIDLTNEESSAAPEAGSGTFGQASRGPRYGRQIIDLSADSPEATSRPPPPPPAERQSRATNTQSQERSPEVELLSVRRLPEPRNTRPSHSPDVQITNIGGPSDRGGRRRMAARDEEDDLTITEVRQIPGALPPPPARRHYQLQLMPMLGGVAAARVRLGFSGAQAGVPAGSGFRFVAPDIDFRIAGFAMGMPDDDIDDHPETPPPPYVPPTPAPEGFTRSPQDGDELICPNCEEELCNGDSDEKKSVWIVKACGHVYCGTCASNRSISKKGRVKTKPFKNCVVEGCGKRTTSKPSMIQVYL